MNNKTQDATSNNPTNTSNDIEYLLHLEAIKRYTEDEKNIRRQMEEQSFKLLEIKQEYLDLYTQYSNLLQHVGTRALLLKKSKFEETIVDNGLKDINSIASKTTSGCSTAKLNETTLNDCKAKLRTHQPRQQISAQQKELASNCETITNIQTAIGGLEATLEAATVQRLEQLIQDFQDDVHLDEM